MRVRARQRAVIVRLLPLRQAEYLCIWGTCRNPRTVPPRLDPSLQFEAPCACRTPDTRAHESSCCGSPCPQPPPRSPPNLQPPAQPARRSPPASRQATPCPPLAARREPSPPSGPGLEVHLSLRLVRKVRTGILHLRDLSLRAGNGEAPPGGPGERDGEAVRPYRRRSIDVNVHHAVGSDDPLGAGHI